MNLVSSRPAWPMEGVPGYREKHFLKKRGGCGVRKINVKLFLKRTHTNGKQIHKNMLNITKQRNSKRNHK